MCKKEELKTDILKLPHHGSKTSSTQELIDTIKPKIALIGVGEGNKFGHPDEDIIERLINAKVEIYRTDQMGEISIFINKKGGIRIKKHIN